MSTTGEYYTKKDGYSPQQTSTFLVPEPLGKKNMGTWAAISTLSHSLTHTGMYFPLHHRVHCVDGLVAIRRSRNKPLTINTLYHVASQRIVRSIVSERTPLTVQSTIPANDR